MKRYAAVYTDENIISTGFHKTPEEAWQELVDNCGEPFDELEGSHHVQGFTQHEIDNMEEF